MESLEICLICRSTFACDCKASVISFFKLLHCAQDKVLREEPASGNRSTGEILGAGIDKLNGFFKVPVPIGKVRELAFKNGLSIKQTFLKDRKAYLMIGTGNRVIHLKLTLDKSEIVSYVTNPNRFKSWPDYYSFLTSTAPEKYFDESQISRMDLNLDFKCPLHKLIQSLDFLFKRDSLVYMNTSGVRTGLCIGKGMETATIYDKALKENVSKEWSRIELRLSKKKLPTKKLKEVPIAILNAHAFKNVKGVDVTTNTLPVMSSEKSKRLNKFINALETDGFYAAKKTLNQLHNFHRDFKELVELKSWDIQPQQIFIRNIKSFLTGEQK